MMARVCSASLRLLLAGMILASQASAETLATPDFEREVLPVLRTHCFRCHGPDKQEADIRLDTLSTDLVNDRAAAEYWNEVLHALNAGVMPPPDEKQPTAAQQALVTRWATAAIEQAIEAQRDTDGRVVMRRLNRTEYANTMADLLDLPMDYARDLPPDPVSADGFRNDGAALQMSPLQLEYYLQTARRALDRVIVVGPAPENFSHTFTESNVGGWLGNPHMSNLLGRQQQFLAKMVNDYPDEGDFRVRVKISAELKPNVGFPLLEVAVGYRPDTKILFNEFDLVEITSAEEQTLEFYGRIENFPLPVRGQGKFPGLVVRVRNVYDDGSPLPKAIKDKEQKKKKGNEFPPEPHLPTIVVHWVEFEGPVLDDWPPARHRRILFDSPLRETDEAAYIAAVLEPFMARAYRRPVEKSEVAGMVEFYQAIRPTFPTLEETLRETLAMVLIQPDFLYLVEPAAAEKRPLNDWELASRLSYFLWSTCPDETLRERAAAGDLHQPQVLAAQVERMLSDPQSARFVEQFTEQWLQLSVVDAVAVSKQLYPRFDDALKTELQGETVALFAHLLQQDANGLQLLASDFTMLNEPLARHYGVPEVYGRAFRPVSLPADQHRGSLLAHGSILLSQSTGADSHAVRRAVWIRDRLLNDPPAPPPPDVPSLDEADPAFLKLSIREQLEVHREKQACASCHRNLDPWGIALENFDAVGLWRDEIRRPQGAAQPVNATDVLPGGRRLEGFDSLRDYLATDRKDDFARSLATRLLTYAVGRRLELLDQPAVDELTRNFAADGYRMRQLILAVVNSEPFQTK
ncbi:DUF1592 domain-containing protein [Lignipirellula cremea]|nr:DUF1592 domain-containing protein [Lignipirellula cremea]